MENFRKRSLGGAPLKNNPGNRRDEASAEDDFLKDADLSSSGGEDIFPNNFGSKLEEEKRGAEGCMSCHILATAWWYLWPEIWPKTLGGPQTDHGVAFSPFSFPPDARPPSSATSTLPVFCFSLK